jgi:hypothetical protein
VDSHPGSIRSLRLRIDALQCSAVQSNSPQVPTGDVTHRAAVCATLSRPFHQPSHGRLPGPVQLRCESIGRYAGHGSEWSCIGLRCDVRPRPPPRRTTHRDEDVLPGETPLSRHRAGLHCQGGSFGLPCSDLSMGPKLTSGLQMVLTTDTSSPRLPEHHVRSGICTDPLRCADAARWTCAQAVGLSSYPHHLVSRRPSAAGET